MHHSQHGYGRRHENTAAASQQAYPGLAVKRLVVFYAFCPKLLFAIMDRVMFKVVRLAAKR